MQPITTVFEMELQCTVFRKRVREWQQERETDRYTETGKQTERPGADTWLWVWGDPKNSCRAKISDDLFLEKICLEPKFRMTLFSPHVIIGT